MTFNDDIFIVDCWIDNVEKEKTLVSLINRLRNYDIPIILSGHYPVKPEIQEMVDYYLYDRNNPVLSSDEFDTYGFSRSRWTQKDDWRIDIGYEFHYDYAIWSTMKNAFHLAKFLGKKNIHFFEYDNLPDVNQYYEYFLKPISDYDAVIYDYDSVDKTCSTYIFSIKTDLGIKIIDRIKSKDEYFRNTGDEWILEKVFFRFLKEETSNYLISEYKPTNKELNIFTVWNGDQKFRNGPDTQIYLVCDENQDLYVHFITYFENNPSTDSCILDINYRNHVKIHDIKSDRFSIVNIGKYKKGETVKIYYSGTEIFKQVITKDFDNFFKLNKITFKDKKVPDKVTIHFINGPFIDIQDNKSNTYQIEFIDNDTKVIDYSTKINNNNWARANKQYFVNWKISVRSDNYNLDYNYDATNKKVLISFESSSIGDTLAWIPYVEEFRKKHNCTVVCSTFHNKILIDQYPNIKFVNPGVIIHDLYAVYRLGYFYIDNDRKIFDKDKHLIDPKIIPLQMVATDILGLDFTEIKPKLKDFNVKKKKRVSIGFHSTAQLKYWNNPTGWQEVVDYLLEKGYEVLSLSKEEDGYMGNFFPKGVTFYRSPDINNIVYKIQESELFIGLGSGLSWISWACDIPTIMIAGFTDRIIEPRNGIHRIINEKVCHGCWSTHGFYPGDWNWCPLHKGTERQFECSKMITSEDVIKKIDEITKNQI